MYIPRDFGNPEQNFWNLVDHAILCDVAVERQVEISGPDALKLLHLVDDDGITHKGVDSFLIIWRELEGWKYLAKIASLPIVRHLICGVYFLFAEWRFRRLSHCKILPTE